MLKIFSKNTHLFLYLSEKDKRWKALKYNHLILFVKDFSSERLIELEVQVWLKSKLIKNLSSILSVKINVA